jgi:heme A synthase
MHRLAATGSVLLLIGIAWYARRYREIRPDLYNVSLLAVLAVACQAVVGGIVAATNMQLISTLLHAGLMTVLFLVLCEGCRLTIPQREPNRAWSPAQQAVAPQGAD